MEINEKLIDNIISYFSDKKITEEFKNIFLEELKKDEESQKKLKGIMEAVDAGTPGGEVLWKKLLESDVSILSQEARKKLFKKFEQLLQEILQNRDASAI